MTVLIVIPSLTFIFLLYLVYSTRGVLQPIQSGMNCMLLFHSRLHTEPLHSYLVEVRRYSSSVFQYAYTLIQYSPYPGLPIRYSFMNRPKH